MPCFPAGRPPGSGVDSPGVRRSGLGTFTGGRRLSAFHGLIVGHYEREGEIKMGDTTLDSPSEREIARQGRMKRER